ncbi:hypothetical protein D8674_027314 [Pyrus ussuriensis x Pyrus communis]|uniref:Uncharacterized protein n=1 Tax=Pyrus ussuriensis x Pyrus communis TaxID=2448454 RepID=A0A5N5IGN0_9ROSA|nr:hypothetical protein D8674_027314 [Pyrus ussuriensis x Pyrus communis]
MKVMVVVLNLSSVTENERRKLRGKTKETKRNRWSSIGINLEIIGAAHYGRNE